MLAYYPEIMDTQNKKRVCQVITELAPGGAERLVYQLATMLDPELFEVEVACLKGGAIADQLSAAGVKVHDLKVRGKWDILRAKQMKKVLAAGDFDLVHTHLFHADYFARPAAFKLGVPVVHTVHCLEKRARSMQFRFAQKHAGQCAKTVCVSQAVRDFYMQKTGLPEEKLSVIYNGVDTEKFYVDDAAKEASLWDLDIFSEDVIVVYAGRLHFDKGIDLLLDAILKMVDDENCPLFLIAGSGELERLVNRACVRLRTDRIRFLGYRSDVEKILAAGDIFACPSRTEGFGLSALEAMSAGLSVVASRVDALPELIQSGKTGLLTEPGNVESLVKALRALVANENMRKMLGQNAREKACEDFSLAKTIEKHQTLYLETLQRKL